MVRDGLKLYKPVTSSTPLARMLQVSCYEGHCFDEERHGALSI